MAKIRRAARRAPPAWRDYALALRRIERQLGAMLKATITENWASWSRQLTNATEHLKHDAASDDISGTLRQVTVEFEREYMPKAKDAATKQANKVNSQNREASNAATKTLLGVEPFGADTWTADYLDLFVESNAGLIKSISETQAQQVGQIVREALLAGRSLKETTAEIVERTGVAEARAQFLGRDQTGKLNSQLAAARMGRAGISSYVWSTSRDERVRDSHTDKEGETYEFQDPPPDTGNPGEDYNCRCVAIPVIDESDPDAVEEE